MSEREVRLSEAARRDLDRLADFLAGKSARSAMRASVAMSEAVLSLGQFPERGRPGRRPGWRERVVRFGAAAYIIQYRVDENTVFVARIFHSRERR